jgi:integrase
MDTLNDWPRQDIARMVKIAMLTGMRRGELFRLKLEYIDFDAPCLILIFGIHYEMDGRIHREGEKADRQATHQGTRSPFPVGPGYPSGRAGSGRLA